ncbi:MAG: hexosaminidase, partial [Pseudohongiellaceae bacterium]
MPIRYTLDGRKPTNSSPLYDECFPITSSTRVRAASFRDGRRLGRLNEREISLHLAAGHPAKLISAPDESGAA